MKKIVLMLSGVMLLWSCATSDKGELTGVRDRQIFEDIDPVGMVFVEQGNFIMGGGAQDNVYGVTSPLRTVQVGSFFMDETEITNNEYREFVYWVRDSIARKILSEGDNGEAYLISQNPKTGEEYDPAILNWDEKINWND